jgi:hypothetical protein
MLPLPSFRDTQFTASTNRLITFRITQFTGPDMAPWIPRQIPPIADTASRNNVRTVPPAPNKLRNTRTAAWTGDVNTAWTRSHDRRNAPITQSRPVRNAFVIWSQCRVMNNVANPTGPVRIAKMTGQFRRTQFTSPGTRSGSCQ